jgi:uncharacterized membrane protein YeaQ/YmgE (transglycosylase-associated protein family)
MLHVLGWIVFGLFVGIIARFLMPGPQPLGFLRTALVGIAGSFIGGFLANLYQGGSLTEPRATGWIGSIFGAVVLLLIYGWVSKRNLS